MRRDKTAARILLILSAAQIAVAAPATVRLRSLDVVKNVAPALEKRGNSDESSHPFPQTGNDLAGTSGTAPSQDDVQTTSGTPTQDDPLPESGTLHLHDGPQPTPGTPPSPDDTPSGSGTSPSLDPPPASGTLQLHNDARPTPETPPSPDDLRPTSGTLQLHNNPQPTQGTPLSPDNTPSRPGTSPSLDDPPPASGTLQLQNDARPTPGTPPSPDDTLSGPGTSPSPASGTLQLHNNPQPMPGAPLSPDDTPQGSESPPSQADSSPWWRDTNWRTPEEMLRGDSSGSLASSSDIPPLHDNMLWLYRNSHPPEEGLQGESSGVPQLHDDPWWQDTNWREMLRVESSGSPASSSDIPNSHPPGEMLQGESSGVPQLHDDPWWQRTNWRPPGEMLQGESSGVSQLHDDPWWRHTNWRSPGETLQGESPEVPQLQDPPLWRYTNWGVGESLHRGSSGASSTTLETPQLQNYLPPHGPPASGTSQVHTVGSEEFDNSYRWHNDLRVVEGAPSSSDFDPDAPMPVESEAPSSTWSSPPLELEAAPPAPEAHPFFNDARKQTLKTFAKIGAIAGASVVISLGIQKLIKDHSSHGAQSAGRDLASGGVVGRGTSMHPRPPPKPVSHALANLRNEDFRLLRILTRRALERLD